jgi:hypothetical protein
MAFWLGMAGALFGATAFGARRRLASSRLLQFIAQLPHSMLILKSGRVPTSRYRSYAAPRMAR